MPIRIFVALMVAVFALWPVSSSAFNSEYERAAEILTGSRSQAETATGLRLMAQAAETSGAEYGPFAAQVLRIQALPRGLGNALDKLIKGISDTTTPLTPERYTEMLAPYLAEIVNHFEAGGTDVKALMRMGDALVRLDDTATKAGLPGFAKIVDATFGKTALGARVLGTLKAVMGVTGQGKKGLSREAALEEEMKRRQDALLALVPPSIMPYAPLVPMVTAVTRYSARIWDQSSQAMDLVSDAIRTGKFDDEKYAILREKMVETISRGPWDVATMKDSLLQWCQQMPELGRYCSEIFREVKYALNSKVCSAVNCDCENVQSSFFSEYRNQCRAYELEAKLLCAAADKVVLGCRFPYGPGATIRE